MADEKVVTPRTAQIINQIRTDPMFSERVFIPRTVRIIQEIRMGPILPDRSSYDPSPPRRGGGFFSGTVYDEKGNPRRFESDCIVATASCDTMGLPSDCAELNLLRQFRDEYIKHLPGGGLFVKIYYKVGSRVIRSIDKKPDKEVVYTDLYYRLVRRTIELIAQGKKLRAFLRGTVIVARIYLAPIVCSRR
ncbi:MAG: hypothetical protein WAP23_04220 [Candidatus Spechtbacterales bacterium]